MNVTQTYGLKKNANSVGLRHILNIKEVIIT